MNLTTIHHALESSGGILYLMAPLLLAALTVMIERGWYLRKVAAQGGKIMEELGAAAKLEDGLLERLRESSPWPPHARILEAALQHDPHHGFDRISDKIEESVMREAPGIDRYLWILDTIVTLAPLLGLLGTIIGMFNAFQVLGDPGNAPTKVTGGVAEALLSTASGLLIAIIGLFAFNALNNRVRIVIHQMETLKVMLINRMYPHHRDATREEAGRTVFDLKSRAV